MTTIKRTIPDPGMAVCPFCKGTGRCSVCQGTARLDDGRPCPECDYGTCSDCKGEGQLEASRVASLLRDLGFPTSQALTIDMGDEYAPDAPWGAERLRVTSDGTLTYEHRHRGERRTVRGAIERTRAASIFDHLARSTFPVMPKHPFPPGASIMTLRREADRTEEVRFQSFFALDLPGYGELVTELESLAAALRTGNPEELASWGFHEGPVSPTAEPDLPAENP
jgi:hypothetical protein